MQAKLSSNNCYFFAENSTFILSAVASVSSFTKSVPKHELPVFSSKTVALNHCGNVGSNDLFNYSPLIYKPFFQFSLDQDPASLTKKLSAFNLINTAIKCLFVASIWLSSQIELHKKRTFKWKSLNVRCNDKAELASVKMTSNMLHSVSLVFD
jgi:hypothetical protein